MVLLTISTTLANRRIRSVGELLQNQFRIGLCPYGKGRSVSVMNTQAQDVWKPRTPQSSYQCPSRYGGYQGVLRKLLSLCHSSWIRTTPLPSLRISAVFPLWAPAVFPENRAGFEVRDVHHSHYGRMCPIETPEGPNIGLISYLASFARINEYGFIEAPYRKVDKATGIVTDEVVYVTADVEDNYTVAQANEPLTRKASLHVPE